MMKLNVYKNQKEVEKTYEVKAYDLMYGTVEDIFGILDGMENLKTDADMLKLVAANRQKLNDLLMDIFSDEGLTEEELRRIKLKELVPFFIDLFKYVQESFGSEKN